MVAGFRAHLEGKCEQISRKRNAYKFSNALRENLAKLKVQNAVIDGELVCFDAEGSKPLEIRMIEGLSYQVSWAVSSRGGPYNMIPADSREDERMKV
jgi:hypothetical protein